MRRLAWSALLLLALVALVSACASEPGPAVQVPPADLAPGPSLLSLMAHERPCEARAERRAPLGEDATKVTFERMARYPEPGWHTPRGIAYSPDGAWVTYLAGEAQGDELSLFAFDLASRTSKRLVRSADLTKESRPTSREEELRRERQRQKMKGITDYRWARRAPVMVLPFGGDLYLRDLRDPRDKDGAVRRLTETPEPELDPKLCDSGERVAYVRSGELYVMDVATRKETALTRGAKEGVTHGLSDFVGQEELDEPSGFWWAPGCDRLAYLEVDERKVGTVPVMGYRGGKPDLMMQRYPVAGSTNPSVRPGVIDLASKKTTWLAAAGPTGPAPYLGRFRFAPDGKALWFQALSRDQQRLGVERADPLTGAVTELWSETSSAWVELGELRLLEKSPRALWTTVVHGHRHLELRDATTGARLAQLTDGDWDVTEVEAVDEERGRVLFTGTRASPLERQLYSVPLAGGAPTRLTLERGTHAIRAEPHGAGFVDTHSALDRAPVSVLRGADGALVGELPTAVDRDLPELGLRTPELVTVARPGLPPLYGALLAPRTTEPGRRYPVVVMVYGGPSVQAVTDAWAPRLLWQHLADRGFVVFQLDNRGSAGRGPGFAQAIHGHLGEVELADQLAGLDYLATLPFADVKRAGIYGHSYGGFMAALALLKAPDRFSVGIAGSPVTDWHLYDTGYTERYLATPEANAAGYDGADLGKLAPNLRGKLLLMHALMDENVHFENTARLADALIAADRPFDLMVFPGERHGYRSPSARRYALHRVVDYLVEHL